RQLAKRPVLEELSVSDGDDPRLHRFLFRRVGDEEPAGRFLLLFSPSDEEAVIERSEFHFVLSLLGWCAELEPGLAARPLGRLEAMARAHGRRRSAKPPPLTTSPARQPASLTGLVDAAQS